MSERMAEIRFPLRGRTSRRQTEATETAADPLQEMAAQIRALDEAAEQAAARIAEAAAGLGNRELGGGSATRADLLAGLASALVDRTEAIRADCGKLSALMDRTAKLVADRDSADAAQSVPPPPPAAEPEPFTLAPELSTEPALPDLEPEPAPVPDASAAAEPEPEPEPIPDATPDLEPSGQRHVASGEDEPSPAPEPENKPRWLSGRTAGGLAGGTSEGVRLIATQMAIAGSSRSEIERRLRIQFGVHDADQALDEIFGTRRSGVG